MINNVNDRPCDATHGRPSGAKTHGEAIYNSEKYYNMFADGRQPDLTESLLMQMGAFGEENKASAEQVKCQLGLSTIRAVQAQVSSERLKDALILSTGRAGGGYFLPSLNPEQAQREMLEHKRCLRARALNTLAVLRPVNKALRVVRGQLGPMSDSED